jgi:hypothetical protein
MGRVRCRFLCQIRPSGFSIAFGELGLASGSFFSERGGNDCQRGERGGRHEKRRQQGVHPSG